ncbi:hypothetical protein AFERRI_50030 [Acidithiobacillus ferrivorans]|uniref:Uncharacterized protein n=1 Tax=Acidithiobacillus ferrivorans TaxID=160808 RepID=A0A060URN0_9PROT|nr:hypothetical protein AFERRI_50030 [Acidithiobacillus ferrivorans]
MVASIRELIQTSADCIACYPALLLVLQKCKYKVSCEMVDGFRLVVGKNYYIFLSRGMVWQ